MGRCLLEFGLLGLVVLGCTASSESDSAPETDAATKPGSVVRRTYRAMGTQIGFTAWTVDPDRAAGAFEAAMVEFRRLESLHSNWRASSDVSRLNAGAGRYPVPIAPETFELLEAAQRMARVTRGKFDVCFGALSDLWRFDHDQDNQLPSPKAVEARLGLVDVSRLKLDRDRGTAYLPTEGMSVHVGGIGKGFAVDRAVRILRERGLHNFMIQAGGDLFASGKRGDRAWRVGIRDPRGPRTRFFAFANVQNQTFSTSGDYERFFIKDGVRYHHIIDPDTGRPADRSRSVTVLAPSAVLADALSTGVFILGPKEGLELVESIDGVGAVIVDSENRVHVSRRLSGSVKLVANPTP